MATLHRVPRSRWSTYHVLPEDKQRLVLDQLLTLVKASQFRESAGRFDGYNPSARGLVSRLAAYTAKVLMVHRAEPCADTDQGPCTHRVEAMFWWRGAVWLMHAGLDEVGWSMP